jgi:hypothetical protein
MESTQNKTNIISKLKLFAQKQNISSEGVLAITIQKNKSTEFSSLIVDFEHSDILTHYPKGLWYYYYVSLWLLFISFYSFFFFFFF